MIDITAVRNATLEDEERLRSKLILVEEQMTDSGMKIIIKENHPQMAKGKILEVLPV